MPMKIHEDLLTELRISPHENHDSVHLLFPNTLYKPIRLSRTHIHPLDVKDQGFSLCFVDGGSTELIKTPALSLSFLRFAALTYRAHQKKECKILECFLLTRAFSKEGEIWYHSKLYGDTAHFETTEFTFNSLDPRFCIANYRSTPSFAIDVLRRCGELALAKQILTTNAPDVLVLDMSLEMNSGVDSSFFDALSRTAERTNTPIIGLSKTTGLLTNTAEPIASVLMKLANDKVWYYHPCIETSNQSALPELSFVKLHAASPYIFRCETLKKTVQENRFEQILNQLAFDSTDPQFLGYSYGLLQADRFARVSNQEKSYLITQFQAKLGSSFPLDGIRSLNAHSILDSVQF